MVLIGAGNTTNSLKVYVEKCGCQFQEEFEICLDNDSSKWGSRECGILIWSMECV